MKNIRYCGNCNPDVHPGEVRKELEKLLRDDDCMSILVDGCSRACLSKGESVPGKQEKTVILRSREVMRGKK
jgi:hypothetical protein